VSFLAAFLAALLCAADPQPAPPQDQTSAQTAIESARSALARSEAGSKGDAEKRLAEAQELYRAARWAAAKEKADQAWQLVASETEASKFSVQVSDGGTTEVTHKGGHPVSVESTRGDTRILSNGEKVVVEAPVKGALAAPSPLSPPEQFKFKLKPGEKSAVTLTWTPVAGAKEYVVEYRVDNGKSATLKAARAEAKLPPLPKGRVQWAVRSVGESASSEKSAERWFELQPETMTLEVTGSGWK